MLVAVGALAQLRRAASTAQSRRLALVGALTGTAILLLIVNPITSARYSFGTVVFALAVYAGAVRTRRRARITMLAAIAGFLFVFPIADAFRRVGAATGTRSGFFDEYLSNPDYDAFWQVANALSYWVDGLVAPMNQFAAAPSSGCLVPSGRTSPPTQASSWPSTGDTPSTICRRRHGPRRW